MMTIFDYYQSIPEDYRFFVACGQMFLLLCAIAIIWLWVDLIYRMWRIHMENKPYRGKHAKKTWRIMKR